MLARLQDRLFRSGRSSGTDVPASFVNRALFLIFRSERYLLGRFDLPAGCRCWQWYDAVMVSPRHGRGNIRRIADVCSGCCSRGERLTRDEYKLLARLMGVLFAALGKESRAPASAFGIFPAGGGNGIGAGMEAAASGRFVAGGVPRGDGNLAALGR